MKEMVTCPAREMIDCPWCDGSGRTPCEAPWCGDPEHDGPCNYCDASGEVPAWNRNGRWLVRCPMWAVPFRVTLDHPTTHPPQEPS